MYIDTQQQQKKLYLGGYRDKRQGNLYHHAFTQTPRQPKYRRVLLRFYPAAQRQLHLLPRSMQDTQG